MGTNEFLGLIATAVIPLVISAMTIVKPIINLNTSITKLDMTIKELMKDSETMQGELAEHTEQLADHDKRLFLLENKKDSYNRHERNDRNAN